MKKLNSVIKSIASKFPEQHRDDIAQEGVLGLYSAVESFDVSRGVPFEAFAVLCIKRRMYTYSSRFIKNDPDIIEDAESVESDEILEDDILDKAVMEDLFRELRRNLSELESGVLDLYLKGCTYAQISSSMSISEKSVDNAMSRIKTKLKKIFEAQN